MVSMVCYANGILSLDNCLETNVIQGAAFMSTSVKSVGDLKKHFQVNRKDPKCRHV